MKSKTQKRKEALARRKSDLAFWEGTSDRKTMWKSRNAKTPEQKANIARADIAALEKKPGIS